MNSFGNQIPYFWTCQDYFWQWNYQPIGPESYIPSYPSISPINSSFFYPFPSIPHSVPVQNHPPDSPPQNVSSRQDSEDHLPTQSNKRMNRKRIPSPSVDVQIQQLEITLEPFKHDRNIQSNSLKLFLKYLRAEEKKQNNLCGKIIKKLKIQYTPQEFYTQLNKSIPPSLNYIRPMMIKELLKSGDDNFQIVLRICLKEFFTFYIHFMVDRPVRTNQYVRREQIRAGRRLLSILF